MSGRLYGFRAPSRPIAQVATLLVAGAVLIGAVMIGAVLLVGLLALGVLAAIVVSLRLWWERRRSARPRQASRPGRELIEAEYTVVAERRIERRHGLD